MALVGARGTGGSDKKPVSAATASSRLPKLTARFKQAHVYFSVYFNLKKRAGGLHG
jgi:hypothetical protein